MQWTKHGLVASSSPPSRRCSEAPRKAPPTGAPLRNVSSHIRSHSNSLKVQTSKGNYLNSLSTLSIRTEQMNFQDKVSWERNIDDLILRTPTLQNEHWFDRSALSMDNVISRDTTGAVNVVLLNLDRNLQLKAQLWKQVVVKSSHLLPCSSRAVSRALHIASIDIGYCTYGILGCNDLSGTTACSSGLTIMGRRTADGFRCVDH